MFSCFYPRSLFNFLNLLFTQLPKPGTENNNSTLFPFPCSVLCNPCCLGKRLPARLPEPSSWPRQCLSIHWQALASSEVREKEKSLPRASPSWRLFKVVNFLAQSCGESLTGPGGIEEKTNDRVIGDNRLQKPREAGNKGAQWLTNTGLNEFLV